MDVTVLVGPELTADLALLESLTTATAAELGGTGRLVAADSAAALESALAGTAAPVVVLPGPTASARALMTGSAPHVVWYDLTVSTAVAGARHLSGRGVWGLAWAIRHAVHQHRSPAVRVAYGAHADQWGELRLPTADTARPVPVAVLLHGGFWRSYWGADLMDALAVDLAERGYAAWNVEYRRPDLHGWDATTADVAAALAVLPVVTDAGALDLDQIVVLGHSAGGQLALRAAADLADPASAPRVALAVSLAGVLDLAEADGRQLGDGAVSAALGGTPTTVPERYAAGDPMARLPIGVPTLLVQGAGDSPDLVDINRRYAVAARAAGDELTHLELPGDHFDVIGPGSAIWQATMEQVGRRLGR
ncbi:alpha/beta hydrolase fold domain-containing protein [Micromonospora sp. NPDC002389]|uniref:alpha/beta hydrolase family protein n=1 Tax=Micromonospora sp. NPDC002389 TaxID=3154272 RepID=UPI00332784EA